MSDPHGVDDYAPVTKPSLSELEARHRETLGGTLRPATAEPRIVTPQEARKLAQALSGQAGEGYMIELARTVATEPERTRAAVVKALDDFAAEWAGESVVKVRHVTHKARAIENGADW